MCVHECFEDPTVHVQVVGGRAPLHRRRFPQSRAHIVGTLPRCVHHQLHSVAMTPKFRCLQHLNSSAITSQECRVVIASHLAHSTSTPARMLDVSRKPVTTATSVINKTDERALDKAVSETKRPILVGDRAWQYCTIVKSSRECANVHLPLL